MVFCMELVQDVLGTLNRTCYELRVIQDVESQITKMPLCLLMSAVHFDGVAQRLEGVKGQPDGQDDREILDGVVPADEVGKRRQVLIGEVTFAWIFFRAASLSDALYITRHLVSGWRSYLAQSWNTVLEGFQQGSGLGLYAFVDTVFRVIEPATKESRAVLALTALALVILLVIEILQYRGNLLEQLNQKPVYLRRAVYASLLAAILILGTSYASVQQAFIYFQF